MFMNLFSVSTGFFCFWGFTHGHSKLKYLNYFESLWRPSLKFQLVQNIVAQAVTSTSWFAHPTLLLQQLYWLIVCFWGQFKVLVATFKDLCGLGPGYLQDYVLLVSSAHLFFFLNLKQMAPFESWSFRRLFAGTGKIEPCQL